GVLDRHREVGVLRAADARRIDADDAAALQADQRAARIALVDGRVGLQQLGAVAGGDAGDDAARAGELQPPGMAEGAHGVPDRRHRAAVERRLRDPLRLHPVGNAHDRDIEEGVHVDLGRLGELLAMERNFHPRGRAPDDVGVGHDPPAAGVHDEARAEAGALAVAVERSVVLTWTV
ncbi:MAG: hypothetical protein HW373_1324, partial [Deltaproteobacteria bacterium]|nr:hypothetical protein [Deltaproteobacteria bacterium]